MASAMFRAPDFGTAAVVARGVFGTDGWYADHFVPILQRVAPLLAVDALIYMSERRTEVRMPQMFFVRYNALLILVVATIVFSAAQSQQFIYFDF